MRLIPIFLFVLAACADIPALDGTISDAARNAPYPILTPIPQLPPITPIANDEMVLRIAALQARATALRQIDIAALQ